MTDQTPDLPTTEPPLAPLAVAIEPAAVVEPTTVVETTAVVETAAPSETAAPVVDWDAAPANTESVVTETTVVEETTVTHPVHVPRSRWDFSEGQRIIVAFLLWLNILVGTLAWLLVTGRFYEL